MNFLLTNHIVALFISCFVTFVVAWIVFFKGRSQKSSKEYFYWAMCVVCWALFTALAYFSTESVKSLFWFRMVWPFILLIPITSSHFIISFLEINVKRIYIVYAYLISLIFALLAFSPYSVTGVKQFAYFNYVPDLGPISKVHILFFIFFVSYYFYLVIKELKNAKGLKREQLKYIFWASFLGYIAGPSNFFVAFGLYIPYFHPFANYLLIFYPSLIVVAAFRFGLLIDIEQVFKKAFIYSFGIALITGLLTSVSLLSNWFVEKVPNLNFWIIPIIVSIFSFVTGRIFWNRFRDVDKLKHEFVSVVTHKLKTPLTKIKWITEILETKEIDDKEKKDLIKQIKIASNTLIELINELLHSSKEEKLYYYQYKMEETDLEEITKDILDDLEFEIKQRNLKIVFNSEKDLPKVQADKVKLSSVIQIILENALIYTKDYIEVNIKKHKKFVVFSVKDNGIGIPKGDDSLIFSKFYRTKQAYTSETEGSGISLFLSKTIIERHGGKIGVTSKGEGKGSEFWFKLRV
ncbi:ATP-binding protein [Patescibacteria group bacterium]